MLYIGQTPLEQGILKLSALTCVGGLGQLSHSLSITLHLKK
jgi:hypothetical protein